MSDLWQKLGYIAANESRPQGCLGWYDEYSGDYDCEYDTTLICEECKYGVGRKDPEAKCNRLNPE